jgi:two-component system sensor histidine kinase UhpB
MFVIMNGLAFWSVKRALEPFPVIADGLERLQQGDLAFRLPPLAGNEAHAIGAAFNRMAQAVQDKVQAERKAHDAEARLEERREMASLADQRVEEERRLIAHELHDEFGQSVTAIRSLAQAIAAQVGVHDPATGDIARLISEEAARLYDAMHGLIPRLAPLSLDTLGLAATLDSLVRDWQRRHPSIALSLSQSLTTELGPSVTLAIYRVVQEGLINALRHARASRVDIAVHCDTRRIVATVTDDGAGLPADWARPGHFGLRGLAERVRQLGGTFSVGNQDGRGVSLSAEVPLDVPT